MQRLLNPSEAALIDKRLHDNALYQACRNVWPGRQDEIVSVMARSEDIFCESAWLMDELIDADEDNDAVSLARELWSHVVSDIGQWNNGISLADRYLIISTIFRLVATSFSLHWHSRYCDELRDALLSVVDEKRPFPKDLPDLQLHERQQEELLEAIIPCSQMLNDWVNEYIDNSDFYLSEEIDLALNPSLKVKPEKPGSRKADFKPVTATFRKDGTVLNANITLVFQFLVEKKWIANHSNPDAFLALFSGNTSDQTIVWLKAKGVLRDLFKMLIDENIITCPEGYSYLQITSSHFTDNNGNYLTDLKGGYKGKKIQTDLSHILVLMKAKYQNQDD